MDETKGIFIGRELAGEGQRKNGASYKRYKAKFKPSLDSTKSFSITIFAPLNLTNSLQIDQLQEGIMYKILYNESQFQLPDGTMGKSKTAAGLFIPSDSVVNQGGYVPANQLKQGLQAQIGTISQTPIQTQVKLNNPDLSKFEAFKQAYFKKMAEVQGMQPNPTHMLGCFIATYEKERVAELLTKCQEALK